MSDPAKQAGWATVSLGDVVQQVKDRVDPEESGLERYVAGEHMDTDDLRIRRWGEVGDGYLGPAFHMRFKPGQVLYGSRRTYLRKVALAEFEGITANTTYVLETKDPDVLLPELLPFLMQTEALNSHSVRESKGSVNPYVNLSDLAWYEFALPPLDEQRRIVEALQAARNSSENYRRLLGVAAQARLALVFDFDVRIPVDGMTALGEVTLGIQAGKSPASPGQAATEEEYGVLKVSAVGDWEYLESENKAISGDAFVPDLEVKAGDFLVTRANADPDSVGRTCIVKTTRSNLMLSDKTWRLCFDRQQPYDQHALLAWTKSRTFRRHIRKYLGGTDAKNVSQERFLEAPVPKHDGSFAMFGRRISELGRDVDLLGKRACDARKLDRRLLAKVLGQ